jgi:thiazole synthase
MGMQVIELGEDQEQEDETAAVDDKDEKHIPYKRFAKKVSELKAEKERNAKIACDYAALKQQMDNITEGLKIIIQPKEGVITPDKIQDNVSDDMLVIGNRRFHSRLMVGTGKYRSPQEKSNAIAASGAEIVTVALRRVNLADTGEGAITRIIPPEQYTYLPNTAGCYTADEAVRTLRLARELGDYRLVKLEVIGDKTMLYPDVIETVRAAEILVNEGFEVMAYTSDDPLIAARLEEIGCVAIMPLGSPIGSGRGIQNPFNIRTIVEQASVPIILDAGIGTPSHAAQAMELGCDGVLMNTAIAEAGDAVLMARAMKAAVEAGRMAYHAKRMPVRDTGKASSPEQGLV